MTMGVDFVTRAHALWRVRMAQWQQRFGFFSKLILASTVAGASVTVKLISPEDS